jgi:hypothetical protein
MAKAEEPVVRCLGEELLEDVGNKRVSVEGKAASWISDSRRHTSAKKKRSMER